MHRTGRLVATSVLLLGAGVGAQAYRDALFSDRYLSGPLLGRIELGPNSTAQPVLFRWVNPGNAQFVPQSETMPFTRSGGIAPVDEGGNPARFLVSGWNPATSTGHLAVVQLTDQPQWGIATEQTATLAGIDPVRACWTSGTIFLIDGAGTRIVAAPWDGTTNLPTSFAKVIDKKDHWPLLVGGMLDLHPATPSGVLVQRFGGELGGLRLYWNGAAWATEEVPALPAVPGGFAPQGNFGALPSAGPLKFVGPVGSFSIVNEVTGATVGSGVSTAVWEEVTVNFASELVPGHRHVITSPGLESTLFTPTVRHGTPKVVTGFRVLPGLVNLAHVGDAFGVTTSFFRDDVTSPLATPASLWIGFRDANGNDPVTPTPPVPPGTTAFLTPVVTIDFYAEFDLAQDRSGNGFREPIANDPALEGLVLLFQFVALTPNGEDFVASDVFGATILAADGTDGRESGGGPRIWATMTEAQRKAALKAGRTWAEPLAKRLPGFERSVYQIVQSMR